MEPKQHGAAEQWLGAPRPRGAEMSAVLLPARCAALVPRNTAFVPFSCLLILNPPKWGGMNSLCNGAGRAKTAATPAVRVNYLLHGDVGEGRCTTCQLNGREKIVLHLLIQIPPLLFLGATAQRRSALPRGLEAGMRSEPRSCTEGWTPLPLRVRIFHQMEPAGRRCAAGRRAAVVCPAARPSVCPSPRRCHAELEIGCPALPRFAT